MSLTTEQLEHAIWCAREACDKNYGGADVYFAIAEKTVDALEAELHRRKHGPFTLAEATASGKPFKRPGWNDYATELVDSDDDGYMCFVFVANGREPAYAEEILADDYELAEDNKQ